MLSRHGFGWMAVLELAGGLIAGAAIVVFGFLLKLADCLAHYSNRSK